MLIIRIEPATRNLRLRLRSIQTQPRVLHRSPRLRREHQVGIQRRGPSRQKALLDLCVLCQSSLPDPFFRKSILLEGGSKRVFPGASIGLVEDLRPSKGCASNGVVEGFGLGLGGRRSGQGCLGLGGRGGGGEEMNLFGYGAAQVVERFADVGGVVVCFVFVG